MKLDKLEDDIENLKDNQRKWIWIPSMAAAIFALIATWGGVSMIKNKLREIISENLARRINVKTNILEDALKEMSRDYEAKHSKKILVLSATKEDIADIRTLLQKGGIDRNNISFSSLTSDYSTNDVDAIIINDMIESNLDLTAIENILEKNRVAVKLYMYFGEKNNLPFSVWKDTYRIKLTGSNMDNTLSRNLLNALKANE